MFRKGSLRYLKENIDCDVLYDEENHILRLYCKDNISIENFIQIGVYVKLEDSFKKIY